MKTTLSFLFATILFFSGCSSSDSKKKNSEANSIRDSSETQKLTIKSDTLITKKYTGTEDIAGLITKSGNLNYSGNEPFARPTLFVSDSEGYVLNGDKKFMKETFDSLNGGYATLFGKLNELETGTIFEVHYYKLREEK